MTNKKKKALMIAIVAVLTMTTTQSSITSVYAQESPTKDTPAVLSNGGVQHLGRLVMSQLMLRISQMQNLETM